VEREVEKEKREVEKEKKEVEKTTEHQKMILDLIKNNPSISKKEMSENLGIRPSSVDKNITTLKKKGYLTRVGPAKGGHWESIKEY
jgi:ATP-dependent DNA helicase RecG